MYDPKKSQLPMQYILENWSIKLRDAFIVILKAWKSSAIGLDKSSRCINHSENNVNVD